MYQNTIPDNEGQLFDCSKILYEITVLLPDQLKKRKRLIVFSKMLIIKFCQFYTITTSECARETVETIDRSTVQGGYSMTSEHA